MRNFLIASDPDTRSNLRRALEGVSYEVIPVEGSAEQVLQQVPKHVRLTVTASPTRGQDATMDVAVRLADWGYRVIPHLSAHQIRDRAHLSRIVAQCRQSGITGVFVIGGDSAGPSGIFRDASALLSALNELEHEYTEIGIAGHPEGHPSVSEEVLFDALEDKVPMATHITTQIVFEPSAILDWARELVRRGIVLPVYVGVPGAIRQQKLLRIVGRLGVGASASFLKKQQNVFWRFFVPGGYNPGKMIAGLAPHLGEDDNRIEGFHVFTFNDLETTEGWRRKSLQNLS